MGQFRLACHLIQFGDEPLRDLEGVLRAVADAGWEGVESVPFVGREGLVDAATLARRYGLHIVNAQSQQDFGKESARYNATLGNDASEVPALMRQDWGGAQPSAADFGRAARTLDDTLAFCREHHLKGFHHAHLRTMIETVEDAEALLATAPDLWLLYDTGHLLACGSDPLRVFQSPILRKRIGHVHLKDFHADDPATWNHRTMPYGKSARFAELGQGNFGLDVAAVMRGLAEVGYDGWVSVELDEPYPAKPAAEAARSSREYLRQLGY
jgi:sugar phosphate isomerase/epimerase